jgi:hypothetical protein
MRGVQLAVVFNATESVDHEIKEHQAVAVIIEFERSFFIARWIGNLNS